MIFVLCIYCIQNYRYYAPIPILMQPCRGNIPHAQWRRKMAKPGRANLHISMVKKLKSYGVPLKSAGATAP